MLLIRIIRKIVAVTCIIFGLALVFYPTFMNYHYKYKTESYIKHFEDNNKNKKNINKEDDPLYQEIDKYNREIYKNKQKGFKDAWSYKQTPISLPIDEKFGYIEIKSIDVRLPLYIGATDQNLANGAAVLGETSIPIGTINSNSAIAGHRGYSGIPYFREIEKIQIGDEVIITNPWEKLTYVVTCIDIIKPTDIEKVKIQEGKDMITLITCHPYRSHGKFRYLVFCERKGRETLGKDYTKGFDKKEEFISSEPDIRQENLVRYFALAFVIIVMSYNIYQIISGFHKKKIKKD